MRNATPEKNRIVLVSDIDQTLTVQDTILSFFERFGKRKRAEEVWQWSKTNPDKIEAEFGVKQDDVRPSMDVELVFKEILSEKKRVGLGAFEKTVQSAVLADGAEAFIRAASRQGAVFLLSAMFQPQAEAFARRMGVPSENAVATPIEITGTNATGFLGPVREGDEKAKALEAISQKTALPFSRFVGIGDSESDAPFIRRIVRAGGLGLAVTDNPALAEVGAVRVTDLEDAARKIAEFGGKK